MTDYQYPRAFSVDLVQRLTNEYYDSLPNKEVRQAKRIVLFSGVVGSGKSTIARAIEQELKAVRVSNDEIRERITASNPEIESAQREKLKLKIGNDVLERLANETSGLIVVDASCDRGYDDYRAWAEKHGYRIILLRIDVPRDVIEQRIRERGNRGHRSIEGSLAHLNTWWWQWEAFGREHTPDMLITPDTPVEDIIRAVESLTA
ncbi:MAG TPA: ATP-binding protein [Candidatus Saccharimonadales bacterium]|nr:ATP-binding protein [Candidatus Saccharimonadales bacterium]